MKEKCGVTMGQVFERDLSSPWVPHVHSHPSLLADQACPKTHRGLEEQSKQIKLFSIYLEDMTSTICTLTAEQISPVIPLVLYRPWSHGVPHLLLDHTCPADLGGPPVHLHPGTHRTVRSVKDLCVLFDITGRKAELMTKSVMLCCI